MNKYLLKLNIIILELLMNKIKKEGGGRCQFIKTKNIEKLENTTKLIHRKLTNIETTIFIKLQ